MAQKIKKALLEKATPENMAELKKAISNGADMLRCSHSHLAPYMVALEYENYEAFELLASKSSLHFPSFALGRLSYASKDARSYYIKYYFDKGYELCTKDIEDSIYYTLKEAQTDYAALEAILKKVDSITDFNMVTQYCLETNNQSIIALLLEQTERIQIQATDINIDTWKSLSARKDNLNILEQFTDHFRPMEPALLKKLVNFAEKNHTEKNHSFLLLLQKEQDSGWQRPSDEAVSTIERHCLTTMPGFKIREIFNFKGDSGERFTHATNLVNSTEHLLRESFSMIDDQAIIETAAKKLIENGGKLPSTSKYHKRHALKDLSPLPPSR